MAESYDQPETFWAYLAGLIDGEGTITVVSGGQTPNQWNPKLVVTNTHLPMLAWIQERIGGRINKLHRYANSRRPCYTWGCSANPMRIILPKVLPYLILKRPVAELVMEFLAGIQGPGNQLTEETISRRLVIIQTIRERNERREETYNA